MLAKHWKKIGLIILVIACLFNVVSKLVSKTSFDDEVKTSAEYIQSQENDENKIEKNFYLCYYIKMNFKKYRKR